ncbi:hypothetical protein CDO52_01815 [Nocardiopsis gilva YIM 90087]|uniref:Uncharacterized protein n=1 Tax=Nocardiopsis gilva YIM 90087 TaxID=1235441 RepID=A0A223S101_9ACTN|nr:hypothetical protein [Nocardiopsis gilva]ASU81699.1 hypothetical protein CDO52_01815 [Nocardiopsis gilva YIM 90087]
MTPGPDVTATAARLRARYTGTLAWYGTHTRRWWAMIPGHPRLLEAPTPEALELLLASRLWTHQEHRVARAARSARLSRALPPRPRPRACPRQPVTA